MKESMTLSIDLTHLNTQAVEAVISFIYTSSIDFNTENIYDIIHVADFMQIAGNMVEYYFLIKGVTVHDCTLIR